MRARVPAATPDLGVAFTVSAAIDAYTTDVQDWNSTADRLIADLQPIDRTRADTLAQLSGLREELRNLVGSAEPP